jgi:hypothetical protein
MVLERDASSFTPLAYIMIILLGHKMRFSVFPVLSFRKHEGCCTSPLVGEVGAIRDTGAKGDG